MGEGWEGALRPCRALLARPQSAHSRCQRPRVSREDLSAGLAERTGVACGPGRKRAFSGTIMAIITPLSKLAGQTPGLPWVHRVLPYLNDLMRVGSAPRRDLLALAPGKSFRRPLEVGAFAIEQAYETGARDAQKFETHVKHIDIQIVVVGREYMDIGPLHSFTVSEPYIPERDVIFYQPRSPSSSLLVDEATVVIFFPDDVHRSQIAVDGAGVVRKVVVKVPVSV